MLRIVLTTFVAVVINLQTTNAQDVLFKLDGEQVAVKVLEITPSEVKYKLTSNPDGPTYVLPKSEVFMVEYANGSKDVFGAKVAPLEKPSQTKHSREERTENEKLYRQQKGGGIAAVIIGSVVTVSAVPFLVIGILEASEKGPIQPMISGIFTAFGIGVLGGGINSLVKASVTKTLLTNSGTALHLSPELMDATTYNGPLIRQGSGVGFRLTYRF